MPKYIAKEPIKHDGKRYEPGASIELTKEEAEKLRNSGALSSERPKAEKPSTEQPGGGDGGGKPSEPGAQLPSSGGQDNTQT